MRILIFRSGALGDFILTLPVLQTLRKAWPQAFLTLVGYPHIAELAKVCGLVQQVLAIDSARFSAYYVSGCPLPPPESKFLSSFDVVISYLHDPDGSLRANWIRSGARRVIAVSPQVVSGHALDHFMSVLEPPGLNGSDPNAGNVPLQLPSAVLAAGRSRLKLLGLQGAVIAIHPGSGSIKKNWPLPSFLDLAEKIQQARLGRVLWIAGEADDAIARSLEAGEAGAAPVLKDCSLVNVAAVLSQCRGYVGNDSGLTHLAAVLGIPTLALFGPTDPAIWGPRGRRIAILRAQPATTAGMAAIRPGDVFRTLGEIIVPPGRSRKV